MVVVDIYGRAGRWADAAEAFDAFAGISSSLSDMSDLAPDPDTDLGSPGNTFARLPMPDELGGDGVSVRKRLSALPLEARASLHPSALVHATTSYLKLGMAEEAAEVLLFLKASLEAAGGAAAAAGGSRRVDGGDRQGGERTAPSLFTPAGSSDPAWIEGAVRGFARLGGWDLAPEVLSPGIVGWFSGGAGTADGSDGRLALVFESLEAFLESKVLAKRPAPGQVEGSRACLELLKACRARGLLEGHEEALVYAEALRWLAAAAAGGHAAAPESGEQKSTPLIDAATRERFGDDYRPMLRSRCENLPPEAVLQAIGRAWASDEQQSGGEGESDGEVEGEVEGVTEGERVSDPAKERRRFAAFALYEAGVEANALPEDGHWTSQSAGVMSLNYREYHMQHGAPLAALNLVLRDMRRKYAYEESVSDG